MNETLLTEVMSCPHLPTLPPVAARILRTAHKPEASIHDLARVICTDPALSKRVLRTVNSSFYGLSKTVSSISQALVVLGLQSVRTLTLGFSLADSLTAAASRGFDMTAWWGRAIYSAVAARALADAIGLARTEEAFQAALLQDIGMPALHAALDDRYRAVHAKACSHEELARLEDEHFGLNHAQVGERLAKHWSLPPPLSVPIGRHHNPRVVDPQLARLARTVHVAWRLGEACLADYPDQSIAAAGRAAQTLLNLPADRTERILTSLDEPAHEIAGLLDVSICERGRTPAIAAAEPRDRAAAADPLTALADRAAFDPLIAAEFGRATKFLRHLSLLLIGADRLAAVNETHGRAAGDAVLRHIGATAAEACRGLGTAARYEGDRVVCLLGETHLRAAAHLAEAICAAVAAEPVRSGGQTFPATVSIGVAGIDRERHFNSPGHLIAAADRAMHAAKRAGRNTVRIAVADPQRPGVASLPATAGRQ